MVERRQFPIGEQDFANIRNRNMVYIDKTRLIYNIVGTSGKYFFFRPRRFGKSLLLSTCDTILKAGMIYSKAWPSTL